ncbi:protein of unknown function DUF885 [Candidatus Koribacter versatilis Ellin345]|uniref:DUF885 domain-containing protein n=1 Tax=Koribacter versatilis (strain Ellin345) TaxID=204669 RepID=Q1IMF0_KORVE|nr:protein of unknown function DUF885 [Candidatus Koribacter versatilis Ellin345]
MKVARILLCVFFVSCCSFLFAQSHKTTPEAPVTGTPSERLAKLSEQFLHESLQLSPVSASGAGYHTYVDPTSGRTVRLDAELDEMGTEDLAEQLKFYRHWRERLRSQAPYKSLDAQGHADWILLDDGISNNLLELEKVQNYKHNPTGWVELIGNGLFLNMSQEYAPKDQRMADAVSRIAQIARFIGQAKQQLMDSDPIYIKVAVEENSGNLGMIDDIGKELPASGAVRQKYDRFAPAAKKALTDFSQWMQTDLANRPTNGRNWRLGKEWYAERFRLVMETNVTPDVLLTDAETDMTSVRAEMLEIAVPMHKDMYPDHTDHADLSGVDRENKIIGEVLDRLGQEHPQRDQLMDYIQGDLQNIIDFIREHKIVALSARNNLKVVATPDFMRGVYSVAGFHAPPPLDPNTQAQYWVTPIDPKTADEKAESKLREYNNYTLHWLTIHEALPGHYIQFEHANNVEPPMRRLLRAYYGNGPYVEGWAEYIAGIMLDAGFADNDPRFRLIMKKIRLRVLANTILDIRMHTMDMSDDEAMSLMTKQAFQTDAEAQGKLQRAKLTATQLPTYYVGIRGWNDLRAKYKKAKGTAFTNLEFHNRALDLGPVPLPLAGEILLGIPANLSVGQSTSAAPAHKRATRKK